MDKSFKLKSTLGRTYQADLTDVLRAKQALLSLGYYTPRAHGLTQYLESEVFDAIKRFQADTGLRQDGVIRPGGTTERLLRSRLADARPLPAFGRERGIALGRMPKGARVPLKTQDGTGDGEKTGRYIWHTVGDGKVRSAHAARDGQVFSWDDPPEGGHPGEAPNCRCTAEDVEDEDCEEIRREARAAWKRHDALQVPILEAEKDVAVTENILKDLERDLATARAERARAIIPDRPSRILSKGNIFGLGLTAYQLSKLEEKVDELERAIEIEERALDHQKKKLGQLERERDTHSQTAAEYSRRYQECIRKV